ncbi:MAG: SOS response-associated peptidase [Solobacterium sp.]|jgi:putative SOS response-associated peptidase YedK|nr:SOS response-associated peptidase [Solobacterium sp.]MCH4222194.1 SOS response-associated peptidase [Solobacterium sp.]MCH4266430.1 SOS response-associated peptidase [Solobacterium sp.]
MCGRYVFFDDRNPQLKQWIDQAKEKLPKKQFEEISLFEVFPAQMVLTAVYNPKTKRMQLVPMHWGYPGKEGKPVINARSETADSSYFFKDSHRCIIPASGYYEWSKNPKEKYYFTIREQPTLFLGGLCRRETDGLHMVILTEAAKVPESLIHDRQPLIFDASKIKDWCMDGDYRLLLQSSVQNRSMSKV